MPKREPKKCRQWERERRNRLKTQFNGLSKVLPSYDPSTPLSKFDILKGATNYIKDLQTLNKKVINGDKTVHDDLKRDLQMLDTRIQKLLTRNEQLIALLQNAGIRIPSELKTDKQFCKPKLWSNRITKEKADILAEQVNNAGKENETKEKKKVNKKLKKTKSNNENKKVVKTNKKFSRTLKSKTLKVLHINNNLSASTQDSSHVLNVTCYSTTSSKGILSCPSNTIQSQSSSIILNTSGIACKNAVVTNSTLLSTPIMATGITTDSRSISSLGPGTLILANGNVFPILPGPAPATIIQQPTLLVTNTPATNQTLLVVGKPSQTNILDCNKNDKTINGAVVLKQYPRIAIKRSSITRTTTVNKVPIPALTSKYGRKIVGKENQRKQSLNSKTSTTTPQNNDKPSMKRSIKSAATIVTKKNECTVTENVDPPPKKFTKLTEKDITENETIKDTNKANTPEKKVPVSIYSVDSLCNKTNSSQKVDEEKKAQEDAPGENEQGATTSKEVENTPSKSTNENNVSSPVTSFLDIPTTVGINATQPSTLDTTSVLTVKPHENLSLTLPPQNHSDFSNDLFSTLHVPNGTGSHHHHPESISPTAAFLLAFPLVSTLTGGKTDNADEDNSESQHDPPTLLQIGNIDTKQQHNESQISFDNIPNFYTTTTTVGLKSKKTDPFKSSKSMTKLKGPSTNILDTINTNNLIPEIPSFQNHIFNYEHTPVTCHTQLKNLKTTPVTSSTSFQHPPSSINSSMDVNYSENQYSISTSTSVLSNSGNNIVSTSRLDLQITKTSSPYISKITTYNNRDQFKYPDFKTIPMTSSVSQKPLVNWMTTPSTDNTSYLPDFSGGATTSKTKYFKYIEEVGGESKNYTEEQYPWTSSTTAPPSTLPMLMGDLALSTTTPTYTFGAKYEKDYNPSTDDYYPKKLVKQQTYVSNKEHHGKSGKQQYSDNLPNNTFLSVSQLVDHNKSEQRGNKTSSANNSRKVAPQSTKQRLSKNEQKSTIERYNCNTTGKESTFVEPTYTNTQNWIKQPLDQSNTKTTYKNPTKTEQKSVERYMSAQYNDQNWMKQSTNTSNPTKNEQKTIEGSYTCNGTNKETTFISHVPEMSYDTQNWIKPSTDSSNHKNPPKTEQKSIESYHCSSTSDKESPFVSHVSNTPYETQNWIKQGTDASNNKNPPKNEQKTMENFNCINKVSPFVSHVPDTPYETHNWMKQSTNSSNIKNTSKNERKPVERYNCNTTNKDSTFVSHVPDTGPYDTENWIKQSTVNSTNLKHSSKIEQKSVERYNSSTANKEGIFEVSYDTQNWIKQSTEPPNHKNPSKSEQKSVDRYNCNTTTNKESTFISHVSDTSYDTQNWIKQSTNSSNNKNIYKNQSKVEHKTVERYYSTQNETHNWIKTPAESNKNVYKNCSSTYSAEALISSGQSSTNYPYTTSKRGYVPTFDPIGIQPPFYNNEYAAQQESTNYYSQNSNYHQNFQTNYQEFDTSDNYNTPSLFPPNGGPSNQIKSCSKVKDTRKIGGHTTSIPPCSNTSIKRTNKRKQNLHESSASTTAGISGTSTTTLPGFSDLGFLSISSTNSPALLPTDDPFHVPNLFNTTNNTNSSQIYSQSYTKNQHTDHLMATTYTSSCNLLPPPLAVSSVALTTRNPALPTTQNIVSASPSGVPPPVGGNSLANFNLSTIFPEINKPVTSSGLYENSTYHHHRAPINNNLPNLVSQQNCGNYTNLQ